MAHYVEFSVPSRDLGRADIEFAVWTVRATLGNKMEEQTHNPYRESNHILVFDLRP